MKYCALLTVITTIFMSASSKGQISGTISINGDRDKFYPVVFLDGGWNSNRATELEIGRSSVHRDSSWRGSMITKFRYHTTNWGNGSNFLDADIRQTIANCPSCKPFVAGWRDATGGNSIFSIIIWMRGKTTYSYTSNFAVNPTVYDGVQNPLPFQEENGPAHSFKTAVDSYVNPNGISFNNTTYMNGGGVNYYAGSVGIGTTSTGIHKLAVEGSIGARKVKVNQTGWADFVFEPEYKLPSLKEVEQFVRTNKHLPDIPSAKEVAEEGVDLGDMNKRLLQKIEEQMLYIIELNKKIQDQNRRIEQLEKAK